MPETIASALTGLAALLHLNTDMLSDYGMRMLGGIKTTFYITVFSMLIGGLLAFPITMARMSANPVLRGLAYGYIYFFRGTPLLAQLFLFYYGIFGAFLPVMKPVLQDWGVWWIAREGFYYVLVAFSLNTAAYQAEILRGGINSIPKGQREGGESLGLHSNVIFRKIILPQAFLVGLRPYGNELILMIKASSVAALVTVPDIMGVTRYVFSRTFDFQAYMWAAIIYLVIVETIRRLWNHMERHLTRHLRPVTAASAKT